MYRFCLYSCAPLAERVVDLRDELAARHLPELRFGRRDHGGRDDHFLDVACACGLDVRRIVVPFIHETASEVLDHVAIESARNPVTMVAIRRGVSVHDPLGRWAVVGRKLGHHAIEVGLDAGQRLRFGGNTKPAYARLSVAWHAATTVEDDVA